ncbi:uncharacterized protein A4U43_C05F14390 [Asparagus officinalis]|uniref:Uncharacterized protein n=1 Tax=Asparagus officinalis TaxID=4686 RepID=A0A5P1EVA2_ASPOF|nr:uncharacterized protein A4U43_C05F14390 [Asparagus officinalis]
MNGCHVSPAANHARPFLTTQVAQSSFTREIITPVHLRVNSPQFLVKSQNNGGYNRLSDDAGGYQTNARGRKIRGPDWLIRRSISMDSFDFYYREMELRDEVTASADRLIAHIIQQRRERHPRYTDFQLNRPHHFDDVSQDDIEDADDGVPDAASAA